MTNLSARRPIRVLLVEDSPIAIAILKRILSSAPDIEVVATARTGVEALALIPQFQPEVVCTDLHMPQMSGLELTRRIMAECPRPILVISASVQEDDTTQVFQLLEAGAVDVFPKPRSGLTADYESAQRALLNKIRVLSGVKVFTQHRRTAAPPPTQAAAAPLAAGPEPSRAPAESHAPRFQASTSYPGPSSSSFPSSFSALDIRAPRIIAIGASTGGPNALCTLLQALPPTLPVPILCVQHISEGFLSGLTDWLNRECRLPVTIAQPGQIPQPGTVYFAPEDRHLALDTSGRLVCSPGSPVDGHCPSVTVLFQSVAAFYRRSSIAVLLTGMGRDGASGLLSVAQAGGLTIAQDEATCVVFGMPKEAIALGAAQHVLPVQRIGPHVAGVFSSS